MSYETLAIVGAFYRPPAQIILRGLPIGAALFLAAEPDNPKDPNAVAVWVASEEIPASAHTFLEEELPKVGLDLETLLAQEQWHLGYIKKEIAAQLRFSAVVGEDEILRGAFATDPAGKPHFRFAEPVL